MAYKKIHDDIYGADVLFFSNIKIELAQKKTNRVFNIKEEMSVEKDDRAAFFSFVTKDNKKVYVIWVEKTRDYPAIAHEIVHLIFEIFKDRGIPNSYNNQESFAYYLNYWMDQILGKNK